MNFSQWILFSLFVFIYGFITPFNRSFGQENEAPVADIHLPDQWDKIHDLKDYRNEVLIILYGDQKGMPENKDLGEKLFLHYHPTAKGLSPAKARKEKVIEVSRLPQGKKSPEVRVIPVAAIGKVPQLVKNIIIRRVKKEAPETDVWLDFENQMKEKFGMRTAQPNLIVVDAEGKLRLKIMGKLDDKIYKQLIETVDNLRNEALGIR